MVFNNVSAQRHALNEEQAARKFQESMDNFAARLKRGDPDAVWRLEGLKAVVENTRMRYIKAKEEMPTEGDKLDQAMADCDDDLAKILRRLPGSWEIVGIEPPRDVQTLRKTMTVVPSQSLPNEGIKTRGQGSILDADSKLNDDAYCIIDFVDFSRDLSGVNVPTRHLCTTM